MRYQDYKYYKKYFAICLGLLCLCTGCAGIAHAEESLEDIPEEFVDAPAEVDFLKPGDLQEIPEYQEDLEDFQDPENFEDPGIPDAPEPEPEILQDPEPEYSEIPETIPVNPLRERVDSQNSGMFLIDENQILPESVREIYNQILAESHSYLLITDHLDGFTPGEFARNYHEALLENSGDSGNSSIFVLINNDTSQDTFHVSGDYATDFYAGQLRLAILQATPALVEGRYEDALAILCDFNF